MCMYFHTGFLVAVNMYTVKWSARGQSVYASCGGVALGIIIVTGFVYIITG